MAKKKEIIIAENELIILDTETTGLLLPSSAPLEKQPKIIEIGAVRINKAGIIKEVSQLINPQEEITPTITKITGITNEDLKDKPTFKEFAGELEKFFVGSSAMICHNAPFDHGMLMNDLRRIGRADKFPMPANIICTAQEYKPLFGYRPSLKVLYKYIMGKDLEQKHRALDDVMAMVECLTKDNFFTAIGG